MMEHNASLYDAASDILQNISSHSISTFLKDCFYHIWYRTILRAAVEELADIPKDTVILTEEEDLRIGQAWWLMMCFVAAWNVYLVFAMWTKPYKKDVDAGLQFRLRFFNMLYLLGSSFRAVFPRHYEQRLCYFNHYICYANLGRSVAYIAEVSVGYTIYLWFTDAFDQILRKTDAKDVCCLRWLKRGSYLCFVLVFIANNLSNCCLITTNHGFCAMENSLWVCMELICLVLAFYLLQRFAVLYDQTGNKTFLKNSNLMIKVIVFCSILAVYTAFLDVPQYIARYRADVLAGKIYFAWTWEGFVNGVMDGLQCKEASQSFSLWKGEISWLTCYFTFGLWASNHMATNPLSIPETKGEKKVADKKID